MRFFREALRLHPNRRIQIPAVNLNYLKWNTTTRSIRADLIGTVHFYFAASAVVFVIYCLVIKLLLS